MSTLINDLISELQSIERVQGVLLAAREIAGVQTDAELLAYLRGTRASIAILDEPTLPRLDRSMRPFRHNRSNIDTLKSEEPLPDAPVTAKKPGAKKGSIKPAITRPCQTCGQSWTTKAYGIPNCEDCRRNGALGRNPTKVPQPKPLTAKPESIGFPKGLINLVSCTGCRELYEVHPNLEITVCIRCHQKAVRAAEEARSIQHPFVPVPAPQNHLITHHIETAAKTYHVEPPVQEEWPSLRIKGYPCASCLYGKLNPAAEKGYECTGERARNCCPQGPAWHHTSK